MGRAVAFALDDHGRWEGSIAHLGPMLAWPWQSHTGKRRRKARGDCTHAVAIGPAWEHKHILFIRLCCPHSAELFSARVAAALVS